MSDEVDKEEGKGFKVEDKRRFTDDGDERSTGAAQPSDESGQVDEQPHEPSPESATTSEAAASHDNQSAELPPINFSTFLISLSTQALMLLGEIEDPAAGGAHKDVAVAKQTIDIIAMLDEKCRGNLDVHEQQLIKEVLYDLRMRYVEAVRQK